MAIKELLEEAEEQEFKDISSSMNEPDIDMPETGDKAAEAGDVATEAGDVATESEDVLVEPRFKWVKSLLAGISIFGLASNLFYFVVSIVAINMFKTQEYAIDLTESALPLFFLSVGCNLAPMGIVVSLIGIVANIIAKRFKTKFMSVFNAVVFAFAVVLLVCLLML